MLVNFILIGAQKSGTTSLAYQLRQHPQISFCKHKEPNFFSKPGQVVANIDEYHSLFEERSGKVYGEASTTYSWFPQHPDTAQRIYAYNPDMKILYLMRHPVERIRSHYNHRLLRARTRYPVAREVLENPIYANRSRYGLQLHVYLQRFMKENMHLMIFEEYISDPKLSLYRLADFLDIDRSGFDGIDLSPKYQTSKRSGDRKIKKVLTPLARLFPLKVRNALRGPFVYQVDQEVDLPTKTRKILWNMVQQDIKTIEELLARKITAWEAPG